MESVCEEDERGKRETWHKHSVNHSMIVLNGKNAGSLTLVRCQYTNVVCVRSVMQMVNMY